MKVTGALLLGLMSCIMPVGANMVKNYDATFHKGGYFNYSLEPGADLPVILRTTSDMDRYMRDFKAAHKKDSVSYPSGYFGKFEKEIRAFYSRYDEAFFENKNLIIALVDRGSGSLSFKLLDLYAEGDALIVDIKRHAPMIQTMDYNLWVMTFEIDKNYFNGDWVDIRVS